LLQQKFLGLLSESPLHGTEFFYCQKHGGETDKPLMQAIPEDAVIALNFQGLHFLNWEDRWVPEPIFSCSPLDKKSGT
jgi:hypothetical protein